MPRLILLLPLLLAACGSSEQPLRFATPLPETGPQVAVSTASLEVRTVELPLYAELEEIYVGTADGALYSDSDVLWADEPRREITQSLASALGALTDARVAVEPWPLQNLPDARLAVRFDRVLPLASGVFVMAGQYYVAGLADDNDRTGRFDIAVPFAGEGAGAIAAAKGEATVRLARQIAEEAL